MVSLLDVFSNHIKLTKEEIQLLESNIKRIHVAKDTLLLQEGYVARAFYFIELGCLRLYYNTEESEKTAFFYTEGMFASSFESFIKGVSAKHNIQVVEDAQLLVFDQETIQRFVSLSPKFNLLARVIMEEELVICQDIISSFVTLNAEGRYRKLLLEQSALLDRVPQHQIASYLGVAPETLSRIRNRIRKN